MTRITRYAPLLPLALAVLLTAGCEDSGVTAPDDSTITVLATPSTVTIDPNVLVETPPGSGNFLPQSLATTTITAKVLDADGDPLSGVSVSFTTEAGNLGSFDEQNGTSTPVQTNSSGIATDTLTVGASDPDDIDVKALSGTISGTVTITKVVATLNQPPVARVVATPSTEQSVGQPVTFDAGTSTDPDGDPITVYRWTLFSTTGGVPDVVESTSANAIVRSYSTIQTLSGTLQITDDPAAPRQLQLGQTINYRSTAAFTYRIVNVSCSANAAPVAVIAGAATINLSGAGGTSVSTVLDGNPSTDAEGPIIEYIWTCPGSTSMVPVPGTNGAQITCTWTVQTTAKTWAPTLQVKDAGTGVAGAGGVYPCAKTSNTATISVVVTPTTAAR